jgi:hypothetical protein
VIKVHGVGTQTAAVYMNLECLENAKENIWAKERGSEQ